MADRKNAWKVDARIAPPVQKESPRPSVALPIERSISQKSKPTASPTAFKSSAKEEKAKSRSVLENVIGKIVVILGGDRQQLKSFAISMVLHLVVLLALGISWYLPHNGTNGKSMLPQGVAVVNVSDQPVEFTFDGGGSGAEDPVDKKKATSAEQARAALVSTVPNSDAEGPAPSPTISELLGDFNDVNPGAAIGNLTQSGDGLGANGLNGLGPSGNGPGNGRQGGTTTEVFGIPGTGNSFAYVFDRSDSMNGYGGAPLRAAKSELVKSIGSLKSINQFQVIFYNDAPSPYQGSLSNTSQMIFATDTDKSSAVEFVKSIRGAGGTDHEPALKLATALRPDVIFFLTDAAIPRLNEGQVNAIVERCNSIRTTIHTIEFGTGEYPSEERWIEQLAKRTGGKYRYVDASSIDRK